MVTVLAGPINLPGEDVWEIVVELPRNPNKTGAQVYRGLPEYIEYLGYTYCKNGYNPYKFLAWYRNSDSSRRLRAGRLRNQYGKVGRHLLLAR